MNTRDMQPVDVSRVAELASEVMPFAWSEKLFAECLSPFYQNLLLLDGTEIIGFLVLQIIENECQVMNMAIARAYQGKGLGLMLLQQEMQRLVEQGIESFFLEVRASNIAAQSLYRKIGFIEISRRVDYYPSDQGREDAVVMIFRK